MLTALAVEGYRSLRRLVVPLGRVTVVTGPNGSGKSSLYRALRLLSAVGRDGAVAALAREGGLPSTLWAGPEVGSATGKPVQGTVRKGPVSLRLGFAGDGCLDKEGGETRLLGQGMLDEPSWNWPSR